MAESNQNSRLPVWLIVLGALAGAAAIVFPPLYFVVPGLFAYLLIRTTRGYVFAALLVPLIAASVLLSGDVVNAVLGALLLIVPAGVIFFFQERKQSCFTTAVVAAGACIALLYGLMCLPGILSGAGAFAAVEAVARETAALMREVFAQAVPAAAAPMLENYLSLLDGVAASIGAYAVPFVCSLGCAMALANLLFFRLFAGKRAGALGLAPMRPFCRWGIPRSYTSGLFILLLGSVVLTLMQVEYAEAVSNTVTSLLAFPLMIQGLALIDYFLQRKKENLSTRRALVFTALGVLFALVQTVLVMIGCFEQLLHLRERGDAAAGGQTL